MLCIVQVSNSIVNINEGKRILQRWSHTSNPSNFSQIKRDENVTPLYELIGVFRGLYALIGIEEKVSKCCSQNKEALLMGFLKNNKKNPLNGSGGQEPFQRKGSWTSKSFYLVIILVKIRKAGKFEEVDKQTRKNESPAPV